MTIQQFIEKAIEGGWKAEPEYLDLVTESPTMCSCQAILDPEAWKAVGQVEGWAYVEGKSDHRREPHHRLMVGMIDALADGKTIEQYLETL